MARSRNHPISFFLTGAGLDIITCILPVLRDLKGKGVKVFATRWRA